MLKSPEPAALTDLLREIHAGNVSAREKFTALVYEQLKTIARAKMRQERSGHTIRPTELVHEAYLRIFGTSQMQFENHAQFFRIAALEMRRYLMDYGRAYRGPKRRRDLAVSLPEELLSVPETASLTFVIHDLLDRLEKKDPAGAQVVELKFFVGLTNEQIAGCLNLPLSTVRRRWNNALVWLMRHSKPVQTHDS